MKDKTKCWLVKAREIIRITDKCYKLKGWDGQETLVPAVACYEDTDTTIWVACWFVQKVDTLQYKTSVTGWYSENAGRVERETTYQRHVPQQISPENSQPNADLLR